LILLLPILSTETHQNLEKSYAFRVIANIIYSNYSDGHIQSENLPDASHRRMLIILCGVFMLLLQRNNATTINGFEWTLYSHKVADHCLLHDERLFCRDQDSLPSNVLLCTEGIIWNFSTLKDNSINTDDLMRWRSPFEIVEHYASYLDTN